MQVEFPQENEVSPEDAFKKYKYLIDSHLYFLKRQSDCGFFYWKVTGVFFLLSVVFCFLHDHEIVTTPLIGIIFSGLGAAAIFRHTLNIDLQYGIQAAICRKDGLRIEKKFDYPYKLMNIFEDMRDLSYRGHLISRLFPIGIVTLSTTLAGMLLALKTAAWVAILVLLFSAIILFIGVTILIKKTREIF